jgi:hypothetical protein
MQKIHLGFIVLWMLMCSGTFAGAQVSIGIGLPNVSIGINLPLYPEFARVPGYPVYYAPRLEANYFFYDGLYWVYQDDTWYSSSWYNGPWWHMEPEMVPLYILRIPVRYYRQPPVYFRGWHANSPPRWGQRWGHDWEQRHRGWDTWKRSSAPAPAPLPVYQRKYSGDRYPRAEQQQTLRSQHYRYQPRDKIVRQHFKQQVDHKAPAPVKRGREEGPAMKGPQQQGSRRSTGLPQGGTAGQRTQPPHRGDENIHQAAPVPVPSQQRGPAGHDPKLQPSAAQREQQAPRSQGQEHRSQGRGESQESDRGHGQREKKNEGRGGERNN